MSRAEDICFQSLKLVLADDVVIIKNYRPKWLTNPATNKPLEVDFYLPESKVCFEIQGPHHYEDPIQRSRDELKRKLIHESGNFLFELSIFQISPSTLYRKLMGLSYSKSIHIRLNTFRPTWLEFNKVVNDYKTTIITSFGTGPCTISPNTHNVKAVVDRRRYEIEERLKYDPRVKLILGGKEVCGVVMEKIKKSYKIRIFGSNEIVIRKSKSFKFGV